MGRLRYIRLTRRQRVRVWLAIILLALTALGLRCLFVLPCMLYLSGTGFSRACRSLERGQAAKAAINWRMLLFCVFVLLAGTVVECAIVPKFFALILARMS